jgi:hypothetical protein
MHVLRDLLVVGELGSAAVEVTGPTSLSPLKLRSVTGQIFPVSAPTSGHTGRRYGFLYLLSLPILVLGNYMGNQEQGRWIEELFWMDCALFGLSRVFIFMPVQHHENN